MMFLMACLMVSIRCGARNKGKENAEKDKLKRNEPQQRPVIKVIPRFRPRGASHVLRCSATLETAKRRKSREREQRLAWSFTVHAHRLKRKSHTLSPKIRSRRRETRKSTNTQNGRKNRGTRVAAREHPTVSLRKRACPQEHGLPAQRSGQDLRKRVRPATPRPRLRQSTTRIGRHRARPSFFTLYPHRVMARFNRIGRVLQERFLSSRCGQLEVGS